MKKKLRVLIVDDSTVIRTLLSRILGSDPDIEVVGTAPDPYIAREMLIELKPDAMTLDIDMPKMDGITFLGKVMEHFPTRTLIFSALTQESSTMVLKAMDEGAIDVMNKPDGSKGLTALSAEIISRVKIVARANLRPVKKSSQQRAPIQTKATVNSSSKIVHQVLAIASSTGGTTALQEILPFLPQDLPPTLIVQHMPPVFTKAYAASLQKICPFEVKEAESGDRLEPGRVLLAPGNFHMEVYKSGHQYLVKLHQEALLHGVRPAADYLMKSVAKQFGPNAIGLVLTGMGRDGAEGLLAMKNAGAFNIAQDEQSCVVFGMPKVAIELGATHKTIALDKIAGEIISHIKIRNAA